MQLACFLNEKITAFGFVAPGPLTTDAGGGGAAKFVDEWHCLDPQQRLRQGRIPIMHIHGYLDVAAVYHPNVVPTVQKFAQTWMGMSEQGSSSSCMSNGYACMRRRWSRYEPNGGTVSYILDTVAVRAPELFQPTSRVPLWAGVGCHGASC